MAKRREISAAQAARAEEQKAARAAGIKTLGIRVPDICRAVPGGLGEGAYIEVSVIFPAVRTSWGRGQFVQRYAVGKRGRLEFLEQPRRFFQKIDGLSPLRHVSEIPNGNELFYPSQEYRSREENDELMLRIVDLISDPAAVQAAATQPAQAAATQPAQAAAQPAQAAAQPAQAAAQPAQTAAQPAQAEK